ncbi:MAG TPA: glycosyltransferase family 2 protein, partial [Candidatus Dormibacteraeota bacterium]|nr:glycosyltransferase family 2 protein [Candidatus Dormibacteraeota bacterium]
MSGTAARVTTVVPTYRRPALLSRALASVAMQTYRDLVVRVYDNASGDGTESVVRDFAARDPRFHYFAHAENIGAERNFRFGLEHVDTEYFSFLSDDDLLLPRFYEAAVAALDEHSDALMAATGVVHASPGGGFALEPSLEPGMHRPPEGLDGMLRLNQPCWTGALFRREILEQVGTIDEATVIDLDLELRLAAHHPFVVLAEPGGVLTTGNHFGKCLHWSKPFAAIIDKLTRDEGLTGAQKELARTSLQRRLHTMVYQTGIVATRMGKQDVAGEAARVLERDFGDAAGARKVRALALLAPLAPAARWVRRAARPAGRSH